MLPRSHSTSSASKSSSSGPNGLVLSRPRVVTDDPLAPPKVKTLPPTPRVMALVKGYLETEVSGYHVRQELLAAFDRPSRRKETPIESLRSDAADRALNNEETAFHLDAKDNLCITSSGAVVFTKDYLEMILSTPETSTTPQRRRQAVMV